MRLNAIFGDLLYRLVVSLGSVRSRVCGVNEGVLKCAPVCSSGSGSAWVMQCFCVVMQQATVLAWWREVGEFIPCIWESLLYVPKEPIKVALPGQEDTAQDQSRHFWGMEGGIGDGETGPP